MRLTTKKELENKKGQMKIQQMALMLVAVTLFFAIAGLFVVSILFSGVKGQGEDLNEQEALLLVSRLANSPEFSCGNAYGTASQVSCVDFDKVLALKTKIRDYYGFWGVEGIKVIRVTPENEGIECTEENHPNCDTITLFEAENGVGVSTFVALCGKVKGSEEEGGFPQDNCDLGKIIVTYGE